MSYALRTTVWQSLMGNLGVLSISTRRTSAIISTSKLKCLSQHVPISHVCSLTCLPTFHMLVCLSIKEVNLNRHPCFTRLRTSRHDFFVDLITKHSLVMFKCRSLTALCNYFFELSNFFNINSIIHEIFWFMERTLWCIFIMCITKDIWTIRDMIKIEISRLRNRLMDIGLGDQLGVKKSSLWCLKWNIISWFLSIRQIITITSWRWAVN